MQQVQGTNSSHCFCLKAPRVFFSVTNNFLNILHRVKPKILALFRRGSAGSAIILTYLKTFLVSSRLVSPKLQASSQTLAISPIKSSLRTKSARNTGRPSFKAP